MADIIVDNRVRVWWLPSITNIASVTTTELNAGMSLSAKMPKDGLQGWSPTTAGVDNSGIEGKFNTARAGRVNFGTPKLRLKKQDATDTIYTTLVYGAVGFVVIRRYVLASAAWASAQALRVYPVECGEAADVDFEENTVDRYEVQMFITDQPNLRAAVA